MTALFTKQMLIDARACSAQVEAFERLFGDSVNVTVAKARKVADVFDWDFATRFLDAEGLAEYERVRGPAWAEYERVVGPAWTEYKRVEGPALAEYERVEGPALAEYERVEGPAWTEYKRAEGAAWAAAYIATCKRRALVAA
jgi:tryptophan-rich sensory protein